VFKLVTKIIVLLVCVCAIDFAIDYYLKKGLNRHYGFDKAAKILCIGHSRSDHAIDKHRLEQALNVPVAKYAVAGMDTFDRLSMLRHYFGEHPFEVNVVVYDVDFYTFNGRTFAPGKKMNQYRQLFPFMDNEEIDRYVQTRSLWSEYITRKYVKSLRYNDPKVMARAVISHFKSSQIPTDSFDVESFKKNRTLENNNNDSLIIDPNNVKYFEETMRLIRSQHAKIVLFYLPMTDLELDKIDQGYREKVTTILRRYAAENPDIVFIESSRKYEHSYKLFYDSLHLNRYGQVLVTDDLARELQGIM
jgi:hypothetical protein